MRKRCEAEWHFCIILNINRVGQNTNNCIRMWGQQKDKAKKNHRAEIKNKMFLIEILIEKVASGNKQHSFVDDLVIFVYTWCSMLALWSRREVRGVKRREKPKGTENTESWAHKTIFANGNRLLLSPATFKRALHCQLRFNLQQVHKHGTRRLSGGKSFTKWKPYSASIKWLLHNTTKLASTQSHTLPFLKIFFFNHFYQCNSKEPCVTTHSAISHSPLSISPYIWVTSTVYQGHCHFLKKSPYHF